MNLVWDRETYTVFDAETGVRLKQTRTGPDHPSFTLSRGDLQTNLDLFPLIEKQYDPDRDGYAWRYNVSVSGGKGALTAIFEVATLPEAKVFLESALTAHLMSGNPKDQHFALVNFGYGWSPAEPAKP
jgi:hypothetical protein